MPLKQEFLAALDAGVKHEALLDLVHRHEARGLAPQDAYNIL
jgi:hypothetical protein